MNDALAQRVTALLETVRREYVRAEHKSVNGTCDVDYEHCSQCSEWGDPIVHGEDCLIGELDDILKELEKNK